ncbi:hypothetical protein E3Q03_04067 [Wallemia mellicola]|uniref:Nuclear pore complex protein NUP96 C-terminal domain-containing protein n=1 Tax=Wallemia mellicola TaxID=1708541 RepID=A0AB74K8M1_9BASI|nr:hypothetical protein E3Q03_04067 [Wallemia mellicola]
MARGYGLDDSSDEDILIDDQEDAPPVQSLDGDDSMAIEESEDDDDFKMDNTFNFDRPSSNRLPASLGLQPQRVQVMQTSFFHNDDEVEEDNALPVKSLPKLVQSDNIVEQNKRLSTSPPPEVSFKPAVIRKFKHTSTSFNNNNIYKDQALALGRSFRPGLSNIEYSYISKQSPSIVAFKNAAEDSNRTAIEKLLQLQLQYTSIELDQDSGLPVASTDYQLRFKNFVGTFNQDDYAHEATYWRLASALFDEIDLDLPENTSDTLISRVLAVRRKEALSNWLKSTVSETVESEIKESQEEVINRVFSLLTGNQIVRAANLAMSIGDYKLATLITQSPGDSEFRNDLYSQIQKWKEHKVDSQIDSNYRKVYALLAGITDNLEGNKSFDNADKADMINISQGLDWLRSFGLRLWYGTLDEQGINDAVDAYDNAFNDEDGKFEPTASAPIAHHHIDKKSGPFDAIYSLIKLFIDPAYTLERALEPIGFSSSKQDWRLSWHVYTILSRVLRLRDFGGRFDVAMDENQDGTVEGHSQKADNLAINYASQVERAGLYQWSIFILLHLELDDMRESAIKDSLTRNVMNYSEQDEAFLVDKLCIPQTWLAEAKATYAHYQGNIYEEYKLLLAAEQYTGAHFVAVNTLAPEAIIRDDLDLLNKLLQPFENVDVSVDNWSSSGKLLLEYTNILKRVPELIVGTTSEKADASDRGQLREIYRRLPILIKSLNGIFKYKQIGQPDTVQFKITLSEMTEKLLNIERILREYIFTQGKTNANEFVDPFYSTSSNSLLLTEGARLGLLENESFSVFKTSLEGR